VTAAVPGSLRARENWPIVVGGCYRSGTSLVRRLLNAHSRIHCPAELKFFVDFFGDYTIEDQLAHLRFAATARQVLPAGDALGVLGGALIELHRRAAARADKPRWADKAPENAVYLSQWQQLLGDEWHFVLVVRNPLDTVASLTESPFRLSVPEGLAGRIATYTRFVERGLEWMLDHPERSHLVVYERLVSAPDERLQALMSAVGERPEPAQLEFGALEHGRGLEDRKIRSTRTVHADSLHRWPDVLDAATAGRVWAATAGLWRRIDPDLACCCPPDNAVEGA